MSKVFWEINLKWINFMKKHKLKYNKQKIFVDEEREWFNLTAQKRILETTKLWQLYIALGGKLDPEPDPQSPFYFKETSG
jgi:hypothetical protein